MSDYHFNNQGEKMKQQPKKQLSTLKVVLLTIACTILAIILAIGMLLYHISSELKDSSQATAKVLQEYTHQQDSSSSSTADAGFGQIPSFNTSE
tara:strand:- start:221 stop:502 length:282 start_codon:yes stop_codon:yes gene_type:complete